MSLSKLLGKRETVDHFFSLQFKRSLTGKCENKKQQKTGKNLGGKKQNKKLSSVFPPHALKRNNTWRTLLFRRSH